MKVSKNIYLQTFGVVVIVLALFRCSCPQILTGEEVINADSLVSSTVTERVLDTISTTDILGVTPAMKSNMTLSNLKVAKANYDRSTTAAAQNMRSEVHPIFSVPSFKDCFPDNQDVHILGVKRWGVDAVYDRNEAEKRMSDLVYVGANPYFTVDNLSRSIPYLVPRAANLLNDIGRNYFDSLYVKGIPLHRIIVTSAMRTKTDVKKLQKHNVNATENSCHLYGTTFDICYNRYVTVSNPSQPERRAVQNDTLKWVLSEVLRDMRMSDRCYIKYEVKQGCFHITVK